jgi:urea transport system ATP-binding protein
MLNVEKVDLFYGASQALRGVSLAARPGRITCVLGRNGVGKTSLMRAIVGRSPVAKGKVEFDGTDIAAQPAFERARLGIAYVPQGREIFPLLTVEENLRTGLSALPRKSRAMNTEIYGDLSGGQQQQLAIARALVMRPRLLVLDEPTEGIQPSIIKDIGRTIALLRDRGGMAIVLVEQYFDFARELADDMVVLDRGEVVMAGASADLDHETVRRHMTI